MTAQTDFGAWSRSLRWPPWPGYTLGDASFVVGSSRGEMRVAVWILLGGFALKTLIAWGKYRAEASKKIPRITPINPLIPETARCFT